MAANSPASAEGFWRFSLAVYARPGVAEALIGLQDRGGHNVNLVLFGLWLGLCVGRRLDVAAAARARVAIARLDGEVVQPLRRLRRQLRADPDADIQALRQRVLAVELAAERKVQARLVASLARSRSPAAPSRGDAAAANLRLVLGADGDSAEAAAVRAAVADFG